jgi:hypothetical protein
LLKTLFIAFARQQKNFLSSLLKKELQKFATAQDKFIGLGY